MIITRIFTQKHNNIAVMFDKKKKSLFDAIVEELILNSLIFNRHFSSIQI